MGDRSMCSLRAYGDWKRGITEDLSVVAILPGGGR